MAGEDERKQTRREHVMKFIPKGRQQEEARRIFEMLDKSAPPKPDPEREK